jgi:hypothetical protein
MINAVTTAQRLDWDGWFLGIMGAALSGGAGAVASGVGGVLMAPNEFNLMQGKALHLLGLMGLTFLVSAIFSLCKYLQQKPVPDKV